MAIIEMTYPARCIHCENFTTRRGTKKNGQPTKMRFGHCLAKKAPTSSRDKACDQFK